MIIKNSSNFIASLLLIGILIASVTSCTKSGNPTGGAAEKGIKMEQAEKPSSINSEYSELNIAISKMNKGSLDSFKQNLKSAFDEISELIPRTLPNGVKLSSSAKGNITTIEKTMNKINSAKTPDQVITDEKEGIKAAISALKDINNRASSKVPDLEKKLSSIQISEKEINTKNYQQQSMVTLKKLSATMQEMTTHFSKIPQQKK